MKKLSNPFSRIGEMPARMLSVLIPAAILSGLPTSTFAISAGQSDDFEDGTTQGWGDPAGNSVNIASGGPAGVNDNYMQVSSGSFGGSARLITFNRSQWTGNYLAAGVTGLTVDLLNSGPSLIPIRIAIREGTGGAGTPGYSSTTAFSLPADGQWHTAFFSLAAGSLTPINSPQPLATDLANVAEFRLLSSAAPATIGDSISGQFGVDNITTVVPEPSSVVLIALAAAGLWRFRSRPL